MKKQLYKWKTFCLRGAKVLLLALLVPSMTQCLDLDEVPYTDASPENFYRNTQDLNIALNSVYAGMQNMAQSANYNMRLEVMTEFNAPAYAKDDVEKWNAWQNINNADKSITIWATGFDIINRANIVLGRGENIYLTEKEIEDKVRERMYGQAYFIRAWTNFHLMRIYGRLPIPEKYTEGLANLHIPRKTLDETYDHIITDLETAEKLLLSKKVYMGEKDKPNIWRASKEAAQGLLAKVYLYRASMQGNTDYYKKCKDYCDLVIKSEAGFDLEENFEDLWYWYNLNCKFGKESVFEINYGKQSGEHNNLHVMFGVNVTEASLGCYMYRRMGPSIDHFLSYDSNKDERMAGFLTEYTTPSGRRWFDPENKGYHSNVPGNWTTASPGNIKYYDRTPESASLKLPSANIYVIRFADILLMYAEAENQLNGPTTDAFEKLNRVHMRAGLDKIEKDNSIDKDAFDDLVYRERGWEFVGESQLYFDGLRTGRLAKNVKKHLEWGKAKGIYMYTYDPTFLPKKDFLWKIPQKDLDSNSKLEQNPDNVSETR